ncbi:DUF2244 domain-containing protein [Herbaspirillum robiniae]|uniref:DUF2244 domain-containing protein n=1 Tax=Herbaspirillum robiniae TaxID=2014887 RepID=A0A246WNA5_9BURK|nr:DUF2244 domain-containing protein [Herbaspirillum robiniae]NUU02637.1 DUF2244 domain-containing protein [Herbaspirillum robiniae]OWY27864.1 hypothetical protein CEJ42_17430 [Herbaspirillum robiniae]
METREWILKRNCSIAPRQLAWVFAILCAVSLAIALAFTVHGAWTILIFSVIELSAVGIAFLMYARHATDREHVVLEDDCLIVEVTQAGEANLVRLDLRRARIDFPGARQALVGLESSGMRVEVGRFMSEWKRREFARELERELSVRIGVLPKF